VRWSRFARAGAPEAEVRPAQAGDGGTRFTGLKAEAALSAHRAAFQAAGAKRKAPALGHSMPEAGHESYDGRDNTASRAHAGGDGSWPWQDGYNPAKVLAPFGEPEWHPIDERVNGALDSASACGDRGRNSTGVRAWHVFCHSIGQSPVRPMEKNAPLWVHLEEEWMAMRFICSLVEVRGVAAQTASS